MSGIPTIMVTPAVDVTAYEMVMPQRPADWKGHVKQLREGTATAVEQLDGVEAIGHTCHGDYFHADGVLTIKGVLFDKGADFSTPWLFSAGKVREMYGGNVDPAIRNRVNVTYTAGIDISTSRGNPSYPRDQFLDYFRTQVVRRTFEAQIANGATHLVWNPVGMGAFLRQGNLLVQLREEMAKIVVKEFYKAVGDQDTTLHLCLSKKFSEPKRNHDAFVKALKEVGHRDGCKAQAKIHLDCEMVDLGCALANRFGEGSVDIVVAGNRDRLGNHWFEEGALTASDEGIVRRSVALAAKIQQLHQARGIAPKYHEKNMRARVVEKSGQLLPYERFLDLSKPGRAQVLTHLDFTVNHTPPRPDFSAARAATQVAGLAFTRGDLSAIGVDREGDFHEEGIVTVRGVKHEDKPFSIVYTGAPQSEYLAKLDGFTHADFMAHFRNVVKNTYAKQEGSTDLIWSLMGMGAYPDQYLKKMGDRCQQTAASMRQEMATILIEEFYNHAKGRVCTLHLPVDRTRTTAKANYVAILHALQHLSRKDDFQGRVHLHIGDDIATIFKQVVADSAKTPSLAIPEARTSRVGGNWAAAQSGASAHLHAQIPSIAIAAALLNHTKSPRQTFLGRWLTPTAETALEAHIRANV